MELDFWHRRWQKNEIGFHERDGNILLKEYLEQWQLADNARVFVPLCGKTKDIGWLLSKGYAVVAIELNESAVKALFEELGVAPKIEPRARLIKYSVENLTVYVGDFFALTAIDVGDIDGVFDRGALVALPEPIRNKYSEHLRMVSSNSKQFVVTYDYDQALFAGPPFSVTRDIIQQAYQTHYRITQLYRGKIAGGFRAQDEVYEGVYLLLNKSS
jgi:thiopurine S-methyltransferase